MKKPTLATFSVALSFLVKNTRFKTCSSIAVVFLAGCAALDTHQAKLDQKQLRDVLMDYTEDQILDNLIRASNGLPIVHYDFSHISALVTSKFVPTAGVGHTATNVRNKAPTLSTVTTDQTTNAPTGQTIVNTVMKTVSAVGGVVETVTKPFTWGISAERDNTIGLEVGALLDEPEVYAAYIKFLNTDIDDGKASAKKEGDNGKVTKTTTTTTKPTTIKTTTLAGVEPTATPTTTEMKEFSETSSITEEKIPKTKPPLKVDLVVRNFDAIKSLRKCSTRPSRGNVLVGPKLWRDGMYYWIPKDYQAQFFALCLATVARGVPTTTSTEKESETVKVLKESNAIERQRFLQAQ